MAIDISCPFPHGERPNARPSALAGSRQNADWWPNDVDLKILAQHSSLVDPERGDFDYAEAFKALDLHAVVADLHALMTDSQSWWPADYGHYGPFFIRMAWHSAGTYRIGDGRGGGGSGQQRFAPLNSWPDNANLDKARRLLWPIKRKYGKSLSWADLFILTGNVALDSMGLKTVGFGGGREDVWEPDEDVYWGPETAWMGNERHRNGRLDEPLGASQLGLIYVNPQGPDGVPDPVGAAAAIRETFARMAMNDEETVALVAGGHTFGKSHGAAHESNLGREPGGARVVDQGFGWMNAYRTGSGPDTITSGIEGAWTTNPILWDVNYFENLFQYDWELTKSPAGAHQWRPKGDAGAGAMPDAHDPTLRHAPFMQTTDIALKVDPSYAAISRRFLADPQAFADAFALAWYKLTHRDMGPIARYLGPLVPEKELLWQDPIPTPEGPTLSAADVDALKAEIRKAGVPRERLIATAWCAASSFRYSDKRGGANGGRLRLEPQRGWEANEPAELARVLPTYEAIKAAYEAGRDDGGRVSIADLIVLGGCVGVEDAAREGGRELSVPFTPGRGDTTQELTDVATFAVLEPTADGFRNYVRAGHAAASAELLVDKANLLHLTAPEMTALVGGLRALNANYGGAARGVLTDRPGALTNDFFVNLLDMSTRWSETAEEGVLEGRDRESGAPRWTATTADLVFGSNARLRALAEVYASDDGAEKFAADFVAAWTKVMNLDRYDLPRHEPSNRK